MNFDNGRMLLSLSYVLLKQTLDILSMLNLMGNHSEYCNLCWRE